jgi:hypothetical protein
VKPITALLPVASPQDALPLARRLAATGLVGELALLVPPDHEPPPTDLAGLPCTVLPTAEPGSTAAVTSLLTQLRSPWLLRVDPRGALDPHPWALARLLQVGEATAAALVYGDYLDEREGRLHAHPLADWQEGSLQDSFDFGPWVLWSVARLQQGLEQTPLPAQLRWHAWYHLRLAATRQAPAVRVPEPLAVLRPLAVRKSGQKVFDYLTAAREAQVEAEAVHNQHLGALGALLAGPFRPFEPRGSGYPVEASVIIPVRNRVRTVADAVRSALSQVASFPFNVIVIDNHSTDGTTEILRDIGGADPRLVHLIPDRRDLGIGGCWNAGLFHPRCGRYIVQLDSDDIYAGTDTLERMVRLLRDERCGMAVGSYTLVNMELERIPPGLIDHREWTDDNGPNNALRIGGLGAPRAFATELVRRHPFPNASYGEDYAVALRISREYRVGRIYESLYLCRRWEDNSDADLAPEVAARYQVFKDRVRSTELRARMGRQG